MAAVVLPDRSDRSELNWRARAVRAEADRDLPAAFEAWERALGEEPDAPDIVLHLARLAFRLRQWSVSERLYAHLIRSGRQEPEFLKAYAETLREQSRFEEAIDLLKSALSSHPEDGGLWEALGTIVLATGDAATSLVFLDEAISLCPASPHIRFHRACAMIEAGNIRDGASEALACAAAFTDPDNRLSAQLTAAYALISLGDLEQGWSLYEARHRNGSQSEVEYRTALPRLTESLKGKRLFVSAEQGLGDEVLFGTVLRDLIHELGPFGKLGIAVEPRLVSLFARSFPEAEVIAHTTRSENGRLIRDYPGLNAGDYDGWALMGDFLRGLRPDVTTFAGGSAYIRADPEREAAFRTQLETLGPQPKIGVLWKSLKQNAQRDRYFAPFEHWLSLLRQPGVTFVNLQYGDSSIEQGLASREGIALTTLPGLDLKDDLEGVAALCRALDLVISPSNATSHIAAAAGVETWFVSTPNFWLRLGQDGLPWYPNTRVFETPSLNDWSYAFQQVTTALEAVVTVTGKMMPGRV